MKPSPSDTHSVWLHDVVILAFALLIALGVVFGLALPCGGIGGLSTLAQPWLAPSL
jgi:hypothetical protein